MILGGPTTQSGWIVPFSGFWGNQCGSAQKVRGGNKNRSFGAL
jgi:hypothetical protein